MLLIERKTEFSKKKTLNEQLNPKEEIWRFNEEHQLYVSNLGRFKSKEGIYKFPSDVHGRITLFQERKAYKAANIVYETFKGNIEAGFHAYPKMEFITISKQIIYTLLHLVNIALLKELQAVLNQ